MTQLSDASLRYKEAPREYKNAFVQRARPETRLREWEIVSRSQRGTHLVPRAKDTIFAGAARQLQEQVVGWLGPKDNDTVHLDRIHYLTLDSQRLSSAKTKNYFRRKISEVLNDDAALRLLSDIYETSVVEKASFDQRGAALAKLTAANFCEIGAKVVYITDPGRRFIDAIKQA